MELRCPRTAYWADLHDTVEAGDTVNAPDAVVAKLQAQGWKPVTRRATQKSPDPKPEPAEQAPTTKEDD